MGALIDRELNRTSCGLFPFPIPQVIIDDEGDPFDDLGSGTDFPFSVSKQKLLLIVFMFWRVKKWTLHLEISGSYSTTYPHLDIGSGTGDVELDASSNDIRDFHVDIDDPTKLIGYSQFGAYYNFAIDDVGFGDVTVTQEPPPPPDPPPDPTHQPLFAEGFNAVYLDFLSFGYSGAVPILKQGSLYYPAIQLDINTSVGTIESAPYPIDHPPGPHYGIVGSIDLKTMGGDTVGSLDMYGQDWISCSGYLKPAELWS